jgi:hypothetical protein
VVAPGGIGAHDADALAVDEHTVAARVSSRAAKLCSNALAVQRVLDMTNDCAVRRVRWRRLAHLGFGVAAGALGA